MLLFSMPCLKLGPDNSPCIWGKHLGGKALLATLVSNLLLWIVLWLLWPPVECFWYSDGLPRFCHIIQKPSEKTKHPVKYLPEKWQHVVASLFGNTTGYSLALPPFARFLIQNQELPSQFLSLRLLQSLFSPCWLWALAPWDNEALFSIEASSASCKNYYRQ